jgi:hypothetical protein
MLFYIRRYGHASLTVDRSLPLETCDTVHGNGAWGYTADHAPKDVDHLIRMLVCRPASWLPRDRLVTAS